MCTFNFNHRANNLNPTHTAQLFVYKSENFQSKQSRLVHLVRTVSSSLHLLQRRLPQSLVGQLQLVSEPAQVPLCFGLDDTQLCVDVLVLICCIFFVLKTQCLAVEIKGADAIPGEFRLKGFLERYFRWGLTYSLGSLEFILQGVDFLLQVLDL